ncbi:hypothetical protein ABVN80_17780 [Acinetobacter baumannii]
MRDKTNAAARESPGQQESLNVGCLPDHLHTLRIEHELAMQPNVLVAVPCVVSVKMSVKTEFRRPARSSIKNLKSTCAWQMGL